MEVVHGLEAGGEVKGESRGLLCFWLECLSGSCCLLLEMARFHVCTRNATVFLTSVMLSMQRGTFNFYLTTRNFFCIINTDFCSCMTHYMDNVFNCF